MSFIDLNQAKSKAADLTSRYINVLVRLDKGLIGVLLPSTTPNPDKARMRQIRRTMLKEFYSFMVSDQTDEYDDRCAALDAVLSHLECASQIDASKVSAEVWSTPAIVIKEAHSVLEDIKSLNKIQ